MFFVQAAECCPLPMVRDTFLSFLLSLGAPRRPRKTRDREGTSGAEWEGVTAAARGRDKEGRGRERERDREQ